MSRNVTDPQESAGDPVDVIALRRRVIYALGVVFWPLRMALFILGIGVLWTWDLWEMWRDGGEWNWRREQ